MKNLSILFTVLSAGLVPAAAAAKCNADNCARAVTGTLRAATASHLAECSSFQRCTVVPATSTRTVVVAISPDGSSVTVTQDARGARAVPVINVPTGTPSTVTPYQPPATTSCPTAVPAYASPCAGSSRYASACSCFGAPPTTTTAPTPVTTTTTTVTLPPMPTFPS